MSDTSEKNESATKAEKGKSKLLPAVVVINSLLLCGVAAMLLLRPAGTATAGARPGAATQKAAPAHGEGNGGGPTVKIDNLIVLLRSPPGTDRYARMAFELELASEEARGEVMRRLPRLRDSFIAYLSDRTLDDLRGSEGMEKTKAALVEKVAGVLPRESVRALYITDFVVQ